MSVPHTADRRRRSKHPFLKYEELNSWYDLKRKCGCDSTVQGGSNLPPRVLQRPLELLNLVPTRPA
eukprot:803694-Rhodomonas_salina.2